MAGAVVSVLFARGVPQHPASPFTRHTLPPAPLFALASATSSNLTPAYAYATVVSSNGGEQWQIGTAHTIQWNVSVPTDATGDVFKTSINLSVSDDAGGIQTNVLAIATSAPTVVGVNQFTWAIPSTVSEGRNYRITVQVAQTRASDGGTSYLSDSSDGSFMIYATDPNAVPTPTPLPPTLDNASVTVRSPVGGEQWKNGSVQTIRWHVDSTSQVSQPVFTVIFLDLVDHCSTKLRAYTVVQGIGSVVGDNQYQWAIPPSSVLPEMAIYRVTVGVQTGGSYGFSSGVYGSAPGAFTIYDTTDPSLIPKSYLLTDAHATVLTPNGGETLLTGQSFPIRWHFSKAPDVWKGPFVTTIALQHVESGGVERSAYYFTFNNPITVEGDNTFTGTIPVGAKAFDGTTIGGSAYRVLVEVHQLSYDSATGYCYLPHDESDQNMSVQSSTCTHYTYQTSSVNPQTVDQGTKYQMSCDYGQANIDCIQASSNAGSCVWTGWSGSAATFSCNATYSGTSTNSCLLVGGTSSDCCARTDADGSVAVKQANPALTIESPNGGEIWEVGKTYTLKWYLSGVSSSISPIPTVIELKRASGSLDNPVLYGVVRIADAAQTVAGENQLSWTIPATGYYGYAISGTSYRVVAQLWQSPFYQSDLSDRNFTITTVPQPTPTFSCASYTLVSGSTKPQAIGKSGTFQVSCDYGKANIDCLRGASGAGTCTWTGWNGTAALFSCNASNTGIFSSVCSAAPGTTSNCCASTDQSGVVTISSATTVSVFTTTNASGDHAPVIAPIAPQTIKVSQTLTFTVSATDPDGDAVTLKALYLRRGASFNPATGVFTWTPTAQQARRRHRIVFSASDGKLNGQRAVTITVLP